MRVKETSDDYRYFPEPDLPPLHLDAAWLDGDPGRAAGAAGGAPRALPRRPRAVRRTTPAVLVADPDATALFEATLAADPALEPKPVANWVTGEYLRLRNAAGREPVAVDAGRARRRSSRRSTAGSISRAQGREVLEAHVATGEPRPRSSPTRGFRQISDAGALGAAVDDVLAANPAAVADYRAGKAQAVGFLVGQVMKATRGQANAALVQAAVRERLDADATRRADRVGPSTSSCGSPASR